MVVEGREEVVRGWERKESSEEQVARGGGDVRKGEAVMAGK